jgi:hypothetical protein
VSTVAASVVAGAELEALPLQDAVTNAAAEMNTIAFGRLIRWTVSKLRLWIPAWTRVAIRVTGG